MRSHNWSIQYNTPHYSHDSTNIPIPNVNLMGIEYIDKFIDFDNLTKQNNVFLLSIYDMIFTT